jgi:hypothetical protein
MLNIEADKTSRAPATGEEPTTSLSLGENMGSVGPQHKIIISGAETVLCPHCQQKFPLADGISRQTIDRYADDFERTFAERGKVLEAQFAADAQRRAERDLARHKAQFEAELKSATEALAAKEEALAQFRTAEIDLRRQLRELEDAKRNLDVEFNRKLDQERARIEAHARLTLGEEFNRREAQYKAQLESAQREAADLKRKLDQGSQQMQGEALELSLEAMLKSAFPFDEIVPVPKGVTGADLLQRVRSASGQLCGTIIWEAKQTKAWQAGWLAKLKDDQQSVGAEIAVIVTAVMPKEVQEPFTRDSDVWITRFDSARPLAEVLRAWLVEVHKQKQANSGRSEKMELLYNYMNSPQFTQRMRSVMDGFTEMRKDLDAERQAMTRIWKKREMQLTRSTGGMLAIVGDLQGIGQDALPQLDVIAALPEPADDDELAGDQP